MDLSYFIAPLVGGVIGYITNAIAIKMLFRPHQQKYLFGRKLPFTPGIIPKEKGRIAASLGEAISNNLMNKDVMERSLLSEDMLGKLRHAIDSFFDTQKQNRETVRQFLTHYLSEEEVNQALGSVKTEMTSQVSVRLKTSEIAEKIAEVVAKHATDQIRVGEADISLPKMLQSLVGTKLWDKLADMAEKPVRNFLTKRISRMLDQNGEGIVHNLIGNEMTALENTPVCSLLEGKDGQIAQLTDNAMSFYRNIISDYLPRILSAIDIPNIIEGRINEMEMEETETIIMQVLNKELRAIVWLGALLGTIMGCINLLFN